jgi:hypothetical protein
MEDVGILYGHFCLFYGHLAYFTVFWYILRTFGIFYQFLVRCSKKSGNPDTIRNSSNCHITSNTILTLKLKRQIYITLAYVANKA